MVVDSSRELEVKIGFGGQLRHGHLISRGLEFVFLDLNRRMVLLGGEQQRIQPDCNVHARLGEIAVQNRAAGGVHFQQSF